LQGVFVGMSESLAGVLLPVMERLNAMDFTRLGQSLGKAAAIFIESISDRSIYDVIGESLKLGFMNAANNYLKSVQAASLAFGEILKGGIRNALIIFESVKKPGFWSGMMDALIAIATAFGTRLAYLIADVLAALRNIPGLSDMLEQPLLDAIAIGDELGIASRKANIRASNSEFGAATSAVGNNIQQTTQNAASVFRNAIETLPELIDTSGVRKKIRDNIDRLNTTVEQLSAQAQAALPSPNSPGGLASAFGAIEERTSGTAGAASRATNQPLFASSLAKIGGGGGLASAFGAIEERTSGTAGAASRATNQPLFASSLAKIGGGGGIAGGPTALLDESRRQTQFLRQIAQRLGNLNPTPLLA
jgi:hypothetical protein